MKELELSQPQEQRQITHAYTWLESHGQPSMEELFSLADSEDPEELEILRQLAEDNDIPFDPNAGKEDRRFAAEKIYMAITDNDNSDSAM